MAENKQVSLGDGPLEGMSERDIKFASAVLVMTNFIDQDPSTLSIVDDFIKYEGASEEIDVITAFATELNNRLALLEINSLAKDFEGMQEEKSYQLRRIINALGELGQMMIGDENGSFASLALGTLIFYDLDNNGM